MCSMTRALLACILFVVDSVQLLELITVDLECHLIPTALIHFLPPHDCFYGRQVNGQIIEGHDAVFVQRAMTGPYGTPVTLTVCSSFDGAS